VEIAGASGGVGTTAIQLCLLRGARVIGALRQRGRYSTSGAIAGPAVEFDLRHLIYKDLQFTGATITPPGLFARARRLIETGQLSPQLAARFPLKDLAKAQEAFMSTSHIGNIVVTME